MHPHHQLRPLWGRGNGVDIQRRGVGGQHHTRAGNGIELGEEFLLGAHILVDRLDHEIGILHHVERGGALQQRLSLLEFSLRQPARVDGPLPIRVALGQPAVESLLRRLHHRHRHAGIGEIHRNAAAHGARADHNRVLHRQRLGIGRHIGHALRLTLAEEDMAQRKALLAFHQTGELLAFDQQPLIEGRGQGGAHRGHATLRAFLAAGALEQCCGRGVKGGHIGALDLVAAVAGQGKAAAILRRLARPGDGALLQVALDHGVDKAKLQGFARPHRLAGHDDLQRSLAADEARQPLGAARAGHEAALDLGQAKLGRGQRHARMAGQRHLQPAAQRAAMDGGDNGDLAVLDRVEHLGQRGRLAGLVELGHFGAGGEHPPRADQHNGPRPLTRAALNAGQQPRAHASAQGVDWRIGNPQHMHVAIKGVLNKLRVVLHGCWSFRPETSCWTYDKPRGRACQPSRPGWAIAGRPVLPEPGQSHAWRPPA